MGILDAIVRGVNRPGRLEPELPGLTTNPELPPRVVYELTPRGEQLVELIRVIADFADRWE